MKELESFTKEQLDYICKHYDLMPKKIYERKEKGIVYIMYKGEEPLYVGQTNDIKKRMLSHFYKPEDWKLEVDRIVYFETDMLSQEVYYIHTLNPKYNKERFETYKTPDKQPIYNEKEVKVIKGKIEDFGKNVSTDDVLNLIEQELQECDKTINLNKSIRTYFYSLETPSNTISSMITRIKSKLEDLCLKYNAELKSVRGKGTYIEMR